MKIKKINSKSIEQKHNSKIKLDLKDNITAINSYCYLPPIDSNIKKLALQKPTSILNKFIIKHARDIISYTENDLNNAIIVQSKYKIDENKNEISNNNGHKDIILKSEKNINNKEFKIKNNKINKKSSGVLLTNIDEKKKSKNINNLFNVKEDNNNNQTKISRYRSIISSLKRNSTIRKDKAIKLSSYFRRICSYQPDIKLNWKYRFGLKFHLGNSDDINNANSDIYSQIKILDNHYNLLFNDINYYKNTIVKNINYYPSFESLSLMQKINYNKSLEETIGILFILPKLFLNEFYGLINNSYKVKIPKLEDLEDKYVFNEFENLKDNNKLFNEVCDYFQDCYQMFLTSVKEVDNILFKPDEFSKIISCLEKARYNISYINNSSENAFDIFNKDLNIINRLKGQNNIVIKKLDEKLRENYSFKNNNEKQKEKRIYNSLTDRNDYNNKSNNLRKSPYKKNKLKSIISSKMMVNIMRHCREDSKIKISTERINNIMDGDDTDKIKNIPPVIRMNLI